MHRGADGGRGRAPSASHDEESALAQAAHAITHLAELALRLPEPPSSRWHRGGLSRRAERVFDVSAVFLLALFVMGWAWSINVARASAAPAGEGVSQVTASVMSALTDPDAPTVAYLTDAALRALTPLRGASGKLRAQFAPGGAPIVADSLPAGTEVRYSSGAVAESTTAPVAPRATGVWSLALRIGDAIRPLEGFSVITLKPFSEKRRGRIGLYYIGNWPTERGRAPRTTRYAPPSGFIEVTPENQGTYVSEHFRLRDFLTKDQQNIWPKYLVLDARLVDKLELVLSDLQARGVDTRGVRVMSGFRTPQYNRGGGDPRGRAELSRHMYGDASDIYIDNDGNGRMDDLNGDGRVDLRDARVIEAAVDRVERAHPALIGGCGVYAATPAHGPFVHIDTRGYRARWIGTGDS